MLTYLGGKLGSPRRELTLLPIDLPDKLRPIGLTFRRNQPFGAARQAFVDIIAAQARQK